MTSSRSRARLAVAAAVTLVVVPGAAGHGGPAPKGFVAEVEQVRPEVPGLQVTILGDDERMRMVNGSGRTIVVAGYGLLLIARRPLEEEEEAEELEAS